MNSMLNRLTIKEIIEKYPFVINFFEENGLNVENYGEKTFDDYLNHFTQEEIEEWGIDVENLKDGLAEYISQMIEFLGLKEEKSIDSITIIGGTDKSGNKEQFGQLTIHKSQIVSIVGPTGSGKSRLLGDIEWIAQGDTPTKRRILINGQVPDMKWRFSSNNKLVAQLSQNMNFVMDLTVHEFLELHAQSRMVVNEKQVIKEIVEAANNLSGEKFNLNSQITSLSGGQSRALMIADTAILSSSPIVLIDEIENAGINRKEALKLLVGSNKIVLMATHDPILALMAHKRIVIKNGGIDKVIETSQREKEILSQLEKMDSIIQNMRTDLRNGLTIDSL
ncbi:MAG: ATP-binding cassette domain-containing protein [Tissierellia bacterium]|nr:ATP-binding cassette domain-containing protein [Tissierellia bacterium]